MIKLIKRTVLIAFILAFSVLLGMVIIYHVVDAVGAKTVEDAISAQKAECIIVPGAGIIKGRPSLTLVRRLDKALELYNNGVSDKIIVSGDHGRENYDEVNIMRDYLAERGVPKENIFMDHAGFSTYETLYRARDVFMVKKAVIVTQKLHLMRALYIADALGIECEGVIADDSTGATTRVQQIREYPARVKAFLDCYILKSKPKYLGDPIPVSGSGLVTEG